MRLPLIALSFACAAVSRADRLISIPTARKLPFGTTRLEYESEIDSARVQLGYLGYGLGTAFEVEGRTERLMDQKTVATADFAYNYISPLPGLTPGFAVGVQDAFNTTEDGRRFYACTTFREPFETANGEVPADITLGIYMNRRAFAFVGASLPFSKELRMLVEHNGTRLTAGFEVRPRPDLGLRLLFRETNTLLGLTWTKAF